MEGETALRLAVESGKIKVVEFLLQNGLHAHRIGPRVTTMEIVRKMGREKFVKLMDGIQGVASHPLRPKNGVTVW